MKLGLVSYNLAKDWSCDEIIEKCSATGFEGIEFRTTHAHGVEVSLSQDERAEVRKRFEDSPVTIAGLGSAFEYHSTDEAEVRKNIEGTNEYVLLARDLGVAGVKVRPNGVNVDQGVPLEKTLEQIGLAAKECAEFAANEGVEIRMEVHGRVTCEIPNLKTILDAGDHPNFKACWNGNNGETVDGSIKPNFELLKDKIGLVHLRDLGHPDYPYLEFIGCLKSIGYDGFCLAEIAGSEQPERIMHYYKAVWDAYQQLA